MSEKRARTIPAETFSNYTCYHKGCKEPVASVIVPGGGACRKHRDSRAWRIQLARCTVRNLINELRWEDITRQKIGRLYRVWNELHALERGKR